MLGRALVIVSLIASHATAETVKAPTCGPAKTSAATPRTVRDVDWCNYNFGGWKGGLSEGKSRLHLYRAGSDPHDTIAKTLRGVIYGDLDGDKRLEAAIVIEHGTWIGRTGTYTGGTTVYIFALVRGTPTNLGTIGTGTPVQAITFGKRAITITSGAATAQTTVRYTHGKTGFVEQAP